MQTSYLWHVDFLVAACELLDGAGMWDLVPQPGIEPRPPALGAQSLTHWATSEVPSLIFIFIQPLYTFRLEHFTPFTFCPINLFIYLLWIQI